MTENEDVAFYDWYTCKGCIHRIGESKCAKPKTAWKRNLKADHSIRVVLCGLKERDETPTL